jgi:AraC-like DNA-binding protein
MIKILKKSDFFDTDSFPVAIARREPQPRFPRHKHQFSELVIVTAGTGLHVIRREEYPVTAGDVFVISDNSPHEYKNMKDLGLINILYDVEALGMSRWDVRSLAGYHAMFKLEPQYRRKHKFESRLRLSVEDLSFAMELVDHLDRELGDRTPGFRLIATSTFMHIVGFLSRCYGLSSVPASRSLLRIGEAITYMEEHYTDHINIDNLAGIAHMSRRNFSRIFRTAMGTSAINHLLHLRVTRAKEILGREGVTITEAAFKSGFQDSNYFSRQFKLINGLSPRAYQATAKIRV